MSIRDLSDHGPNVVISLVLSILVAFGTLFSIGDRFISRSEHLEFRDRITEEVQRLSAQIIRLDQDKADLINVQLLTHERERQVDAINQRLNQIAERLETLENNLARMQDGHNEDTRH